jgi:hypothetical protein
MNQAIIIASIIVLFVSNNTVPCMCFYLTYGVLFTYFTLTVYTSPIPGITGCYQTTAIQLLVSFLLFLALGLGVSLGAGCRYILGFVLTFVSPRAHHPNAHTRHTELADDQRPSVYRPAETQLGVLCMQSP